MDKKQSIAIKLNRLLEMFPAVAIVGPRQCDSVIIDEAQQFPELFSVLRGIIDKDRKATGRFSVIRGSCTTF